MDAAGSWSMPHCHEDCFEIYVFIEGSVRMMVEKEQRVLEKMDLVIIPPYAIHRVEVLENVPYEGMDFKLPCTFIPSYISERLKSYGNFFKWPEEVVFLDYVDKVYDQYREEGDSDEMLYLAYGTWLTSILVYLCRKDIKLQIQETENILVSRIKEYVDANLYSKLTMKDISAEFHRSQSYIAKQFRDCTGVSIMTYIRQRKMELADYLISNNSRPSDVAKTLGYTDYSSFYKAYMSVKGTPPGLKKAEGKAGQ